MIFSKRMDGGAERLHPKNAKIPCGNAKMLTRPQGILYDKWAAQVPPTFKFLRPKCSVV